MARISCITEKHLIITNRFKRWKFFKMNKFMRFQNILKDAVIRLKKKNMNKENRKKKKKEDAKKKKLLV